MQVDRQHRRILRRRSTRKSNRSKLALVVAPFDGGRPGGLKRIRAS